MTQIIVTGLSVWFGVVAGGIVWFAWGLAQTVAHRIRSARPAEAGGEAKP